MEILLCVACINVGYLGLVVWSYYQGKKVQRRQCEDWQHGHTVQQIRQQPRNARHGSN